MLNANRPPRRSTRATSGTTRCGSAKVSRAVVAEDEVEALVRERQRLGAPVHEREVGAGRPRVLELPLRVVEADAAGALRREQDRPLGGAAAELEHVLPGHVAEHLQLALGQLPDPPAGLRPADVLAVRRLVLVRPLVPEGAVPRCVRRAHRPRTRARSRGRRTRASRSRGRDCPASRARSRRGSSRAPACAGLVAPIVWRTVAIAPSPSTTSASVGAEVMNAISSPKNGLSTCSA